MKILAFHFKYILNKRYSDKDPEDYEEYWQSSAAYYTFYPSNTELVISKSKNKEEKQILDKDIIDEDYFKKGKERRHSLLFIQNSNAICNNKNKYLKKYLKKCMNL